MAAKELPFSKCLGTGDDTKRDEFSKIFNPKIYTADFGPFNRAFCSTFPKKKMQHDITKMRGGGQRPFGSFPKTHPFWYRPPSNIEPSHGMAEYREFPNLLAITIAIVSWKWTMLSVADLPNYLRLLSYGKSCVRSCFGLLKMFPCHHAFIMNEQNFLKSLFLLKCSNLFLYVSCPCV